jgi:hypothetical protein
VNLKRGEGSPQHPRAPNLTSARLSPHRRLCCCRLAPADSPPAVHAVLVIDSAVLPCVHRPTALTFLHGGRGADAEHIQGGAAHQAAGDHAVQRAAERGGRRGLRGGGRGAVARAPSGRQPSLRPLVRAAPRIRRHMLLQVHRRTRRKLVLLHGAPQPPPRATRWYASAVFFFRTNCCSSPYIRSRFFSLGCQYDSQVSLELT